MEGTVPFHHYFKDSTSGFQAEASLTFLKFSVGVMTMKMKKKPSLGFILATYSRLQFYITVGAMVVGVNYSMCYFFNFSFQYGCLKSQWRAGNVCAHKSYVSNLFSYTSTCQQKFFHFKIISGCYFISVVGIQPFTSALLLQQGNEISLGILSTESVFMKQHDKLQSEFVRLFDMENLVENVLKLKCSALFVAS